MKTLNLPKGSPDPLPELATFLKPFAPLFRRATSQKSLERYVTGLLTDLPTPRTVRLSRRQSLIRRWNRYSIC